MSHTIKRFLISTFLICGFGLTLFAQKNVVHPFTLPSARNAGMGGLHITNTDGTGALLNNPAGLVGKKEFGIAEVSASLMAPLDRMKALARSAPDIVQSGVNGFTVNEIDDIFNSITDKDGKLLANASFAGPLSLTIVGGGFGFGVYTGGALNTSFEDEKVSVWADVGAQTNFAYGFRIVDTERHILDAGIGVHTFFRVDTETKLSSKDLAHLNKVKVPVNGTFGVGLDLGVQYQYAGKLKIAVAANDLLSYAKITDIRDRFNMLQYGEKLNPAVTGTIKQGLNIGMSYNLIDSRFLDLTVMADYRDILDLLSESPRNPLLNMGLGAELGLFDHIFLRVGLTDALPSLGFGLDLVICKVNIAAYGKELGMDPGVQSVASVDAGVLFRW